MARMKGTGTMGPTRSVRLPRALDAWFLERLAMHDERSPSETLVALVHGGLRLREGYMAIHRRVLEQLAVAGNEIAHQSYLQCLRDTFGIAYVEHLEQWLAADDVRALARDEIRS